MANNFFMNVQHVRSESHHAMCCYLSPMYASNSNFSAFFFSFARIIVSYIYVLYECLHLLHLGLQPDPVFPS